MSESSKASRGAAGQRGTSGQKTQNARQRVAAQRAAQQRAERRNRVLFAGGSIVLVIAIVVALVLVKVLHHSTPASNTAASGGAVTGTLLPASVARDVTSVPAATLNTVGAGSVPSVVKTPVASINGAALTAAGKPEMLYIGAEFCPYCAAMRWSMAIALSRFGTLSPLHGIHSSPTDTDPSTPTLTFYKSSYTSKYLTFTPVENETVDHGPLQATTAQQEAVWKKYDADSYPFIDIGGKYMVQIIYNPAVLAGMSWSQVAAALHDPSSAAAQGADGAANYLTAAMCKVTGNAPASVCTSPAIKTLQTKI